MSDYSRFRNVDNFQCIRCHFFDRFNVCCTDDVYCVAEVERAYQQGRADAIDKCKYNTELFREIFLEDLIQQSIDTEEAMMYRNICTMAWSKYLEQLKGEHE